MVDFTIDQIVEKYVIVRDDLKALNDEQAKAREPLEKKLEILNAVLLDRLNKQGADSVSTEFGTAYKKTVMSASVDPEGGWEKVMSYVARAALARLADTMEKGGTEAEAIDAFLKAPELALINRSVNKTAVKEGMDNKDGFVPPGVKVTHITNVGVRRA